jgi:hypothetical protein
MTERWIRLYRAIDARPSEYLDLFQPLRAHPASRQATGQAGSPRGVSSAHRAVASRPAGSPSAQSTDGLGDSL